MASPFKLCGEELCQNHVRLFSTDEAPRHYQDIGVIVLTGEVRYFCIPAECGTNSLMFVQRHIDSVSTAADSDTGITFTRFYCKGQRMSIVRIVYTCGRVCSEVFVSPAFCFQPAANIFFQFMLIRLFSLEHCFYLVIYVFSSKSKFLIQYFIRSGETERFQSPNLTVATYQTLKSDRQTGSQTEDFSF